MKLFSCILALMLAIIMGIVLVYIKPSEGVHGVRIQPPISSQFYTKRYVENNKGLTHHQIIADGARRVYWSYTPDNMNEKPKAMILLLHGARRSGVSVVEQWKPLADEHNLILIGPDGWKKTWRTQHDGTQFIDDILADAQKNFNIDADRLYVFGHSRGGVHAMRLAITHADVFKAVAVHAASFDDEEDAGDIVNATYKPPILFMVGSKDKIFPVKNVRYTAKAFAAQGHDTQFYILDGHNHWYYTLSGYINGLAWDFFDQTDNHSK